MSNINDETVRAKMRKLRVSTFADVFYEIVNDEAYADALPEDIFLAAVEEAYTQRQQRNIAKAITQAQFRYPNASLAEVNPSRTTRHQHAPTETNRGDQLAGKPDQHSHPRTDRNRENIHSLRHRRRRMSSRILRGLLPARPTRRHVGGLLTD